MKWVHMSDIHFDFENYDTKLLREKLKDVLMAEVGIDFLLITGDILYKYGLKENDEECIQFIKELIDSCNYNNEKEVEIFLCPGNHDINRNDNERNKLINNIRKNGLAISQSSISKLITLGHEKYKSIYKDITGKRYSSFEVFQSADKKYRIISLDTCLLSKDDEDEGKISIQTSRLFDLNKKIILDDCLNIVIMHHGIEFFDNKAGRNLQHWMDDNNIDVVFCGHSHQAGIETYNETKKEIKQFTSGGVLFDGYTLPSFYVCDFDENEWIIETSLYTFTVTDSNWALDSRRLRAFKNGTNLYYIPRKYDKVLEGKELKKQYKVDQIIKIEKEFFNCLNERVYHVYGKKIRSSKMDSEEEFSVLKIFKSLIKIGMPTEKIFILLTEVVNAITLKNYYEKRQRFISTGDIRTCVYNTICNMPVDNEVTSYDINEWAGKYARRYGHNNRRMKILMIDGSERVISYNFIAKNLMRDVFIKITKSSKYYENIPRNELNYMTEEIIQFLKNCNLYYIKYEILVDFVAEIAMQPPHPWIINEDTREDVIKYNKETLEKHLKKMDGKQEEITVLEALYHASAIIISYYSYVLGETETSPLNLLVHSVNKPDESDKNIIDKNGLIQFENDLVKCKLEWSKFCILINEIYFDAIEKHDLKSEKIQKNVLQLSDVALLLISLHEIEKEISERPLDRIANLFSPREGFIVKQPLQELDYCFWVTPSWNDDEDFENDIKKQMLVIVINDTIDMTSLLDYVSRKKEQCNCLIFFKETGKVFSKTERNQITSFIDDEDFNCIFLDAKKENQGDLRKKLYYIISSM